MKKVSGAELIEEARGKRFFNCPIVSEKVQRANGRDFREKYPSEFQSVDQALNYLNGMIVPSSLRWVYNKNAKTATTSAGHFLFRQEYGSLLNASWVDPFDVNQSAAGHYLDTDRYGIFRNLRYIDNSAIIFDSALRLTTARHPVPRALSSFHYLCKAQDLGHIYFSMDRVLMCALVGFNWEQDMYTSKGFEKFLDYIGVIQSELGRQQVNEHWRPQYINVRPNIYKPDVIGRTENMHAFYTEVAERLGNPPPEPEKNTVRNSQTYKTDKSSLLTPDAIRRIEEIYAMDFEWLGEDPHHF
jgi:hypothetical protein